MIATDIPTYYIEVRLMRLVGDGHTPVVPERLDEKMTVWLSNGDRAYHAMEIVKAVLDCERNNR